MGGKYFTKFINRLSWFHLVAAAVYVHSSDDSHIIHNFGTAPAW